MKSKLNWNIITENEKKKTRMITFLICVVYNFFVSYTKIKELSDITLGLITPNFITFPFTLSLGQNDKSWELKNRFATKKNLVKRIFPPLSQEKGLI